MKKLMLLFGLVAFLGASNLSYAADYTSENVVLDCDKCKDHKCDDTCKKDGCTAQKCAAKEGTAEKKACTGGETKACCKKGSEGTANAEGKSCCKKEGSANSSCTKKQEGETEKK